MSHFRCVTRKRITITSTVGPSKYVTYEVTKLLEQPTLVEFVKLIEPAHFDSQYDELRDKLVIKYQVVRDIELIFQVAKYNSMSSNDEWFVAPLVDIVRNISLPKIDAYISNDYKHTTDLNAEWRLYVKELSFKPKLYKLHILPCQLIKFEAGVNFIRYTHWRNYEEEEFIFSGFLDLQLNYVENIPFNNSDEYRRFARENGYINPGNPYYLLHPQYSIDRGQLEYYIPRHSFRRLFDESFYFD